ncbi:hypothetical protein CPB84DRAFT_1796555 [Gymnopilus junonius]|uniref:Uncharacterized protein n=1 Tax=Gymnopilus junonius TaxID=109634 RepID=A0A9P5NCD1_GYMJU|nr:hypothetical protein CPB84DRAFT_1796555 [Gymnopilus junonius]
MPSSNVCHWRRLSLIWLLFFARLHVNMSLALPTATPVPSAQQDLDTGPNFFTMYGFLDSPVPAALPSASGRPALAHLSKVFLAMTQTGAAALPISTGASELAEDVPLIESSLLSSAEATLVSTPPKQGPGLVMLTSPVLRPTNSQPSPTSNATMNASSTASVNHSDTSSRVIALGSTVGGIIIVALCLFFLLGPKRNRRFICLLRSSRSSMRKGKQDKGVSSESFVSRSVIRKMNNEVSADDKKSSMESSNENEKDVGIDNPSQSPQPSSKFSVCSTEYLSCSPRESAVSSGSDSSTVKGTSTTASPPARPPRPPTADSPTLSDSVYLACSDKPYVIVAPQPLSEADLNSLPHTQKILTPAEFLALHVPEILSSLPSLASKLDEEDTPSEDPGRRMLHAINRSSSHFRTKSEPALNAEERNSNPSSLDDEDEDSCVRKSFSRSASGWAYPDRLRSRKRKVDC